MAIRPELHVAVAKTKNKASDYNDNFDMMMDFVDNSIDEAKDYVDGYMPAISGSTKSKFLTNDGTDANWVSLGNGQPFSQFINGLVITKSTDDTISVSAGSCYDYTGTTVLTLGTDTTKQNSSQAASTTYYVYIIGSSTGSLIDILISTSSTTPALPTGYSLFRQIGYYTTNSDNEIDSIGYYGEGLNSDKSAYSIMGAVMPDYTARVSVALGTDYTCPSDGFIIARAASVNHTPSLIYINSTGYEMSNSSGGYIDTAMFNGFVSKGDVINLSNSSQGGLSGYLWFIPLKGVTNA